MKPERPAPRSTHPGRPVNATMRQLRAFLAVAQDESISRAATRLHLTPSALSMLIRSLEGELAVRLFDRTTRKLALTEAGRELRPVIEKLFAELDGAFDGLRHAADRRSGRIVMATSPLLAATQMPALIASFEERYPSTRIELQDLGVNEIAEAVRSGAADLGICTADTDMTDLTVTVLLQDRLMLACPAEHALAGRREVRWAELAALADETRLVLMKHGSGVRTLTDRTFAELNETVTPAFEVSHVSTAVGLVEAGLGVAVLPSYAITRSRAADVVAVPLGMPAVQRDIVALTPASRNVPAACEAFIAHFQRETGAGVKPSAAKAAKAARAKRKA